ncbi:endoglucanase 2-like [Cynara cardunculus var. scolymus]|uniref:endoglucanase 2-like n=1 Tax=Cynara cardunculus var. scolymus TaxID=59895 RepID=UPI000D62A0A8|nr:endoglucanase 2-like [Cynara cardunculus var. scolymus]XP_024971428.1 endoglucanase 2-like [Cynara cardunculus var. scolymus]
MGKEKKSGGWFGWFIVLVILGVVALALGLTLRNKFHHGGGAAPVPGPPGAVTKKYGDALKIALQFFDIQKSGKLVDNEIPWRGDSALQDGKDADLDLSKGMYDAGDHMKFGFPMAYTATVLAWAILEYGDQMNAADQLEPAKDSLKWITDYLVNAHPEPNVLYIQVGDPDVDHKCWDRPEDMSEKRALIQVNASTPGTEVAAETAAAMASASLVFKSTDSTYSSLLLKHAKELFTFANEHRGSYSQNIPQVQTYYNSTGYGDELLWAASWLYHATRDRTYLDFVTGSNGETYANWGSPTWFSWDDKLPGIQVLLSRVSFFDSKVATNSESLKKYRKTAEAVMCGLLPKSPTATLSRTRNGLIWISDWNALQHPIASAFLAVIYSDYMLTSQTQKLHCDSDTFSPADLRKFAMSQANYVLGDNPMKMSYLVGYGDKYSQYVHHRGASIPSDSNTNCSTGWKWLESDEPNPNVATGALVGGPFLNESYVDSRNNSMQTEPSTYNSAVIVGLLSGLVTTSSVVTSFM